MEAGAFEAHVGLVGRAFWPCYCWYLININMTMNTNIHIEALLPIKDCLSPVLISSKTLNIPWTVVDWHEPKTVFWDPHCTPGSIAHASRKVLTMDHMLKYRWLVCESVTEEVRLWTS